MMGLRAWRMVKSILRGVLCVFFLGYVTFILSYMQQTYKDAHWIIVAIVGGSGAFILAATVCAFISFILRTRKKETREIDWVVFALNLLGTAGLIFVTENFVFAIFGVGIAVIELFINSDFEKIF